MAIQISGTTVIDNSRNGTNIASVTATSFSGKGSIPSDTVLYFFQAAAPTNFTKLVTNDDCTLRVVSGTGGGTGGSSGVTSIFANQPITITGSLGNTTLTTPQIPSHTHANSNLTSGASGPGGQLGPPVISTNPTGGDGSHNHPLSVSSVSSLDIRVQYVDVIACSRDA